MSFRADLPSHPLCISWNIAEAVSFSTIEAIRLELGYTRRQFCKAVTNAECMYSQWRKNGYAPGRVHAIGQQLLAKGVRGSGPLKPDYHYTHWGFTKLEIGEKMAIELPLRGKAERRLLIRRIVRALYMVQKRTEMRFLQRSNDVATVVTRTS